MRKRNHFFRLESPPPSPLQILRVNLKREKRGLLKDGTLNSIIMHRPNSTLIPKT